MDKYKQAWETLKMMSGQRKKWTQEELQQTMAQLEKLGGLE